MDKKQQIKTPESIKIDGGLGGCLKVGINQPANNIFWFGFPPLTDEEKAEIEPKNKARLEADKEQDDKKENL